ncbi:hypothetical protein KUV57_21650 [Epibacterium sp. DP7N7-1]|nr:hypothetical protein [Epibacterium sp. DP7N7-1]
MDMLALLRTAMAIEGGDGDLRAGISRQMSDVRCQMSDATGLMDWMQDKQI